MVPYEGLNWWLLIVARVKFYRSEIEMTTRYQIAEIKVSERVIYETPLKLIDKPC